MSNEQLKSFNDKVLLECAKKEGYKIVLYKFLEYLEKNNITEKSN